MSASLSSHQRLNVSPYQEFLVITVGLNTEPVERTDESLCRGNGHIMGHIALHVYIWSQCGDDIALQGDGLPRLKSTRAEFL